MGLRQVDWIGTWESDVGSSKDESARDRTRHCIDVFRQLAIVEQERTGFTPECRIDIAFATSTPMQSRQPVIEKS